MHLADSIGNKYAMQLSIYAYMTELLGFNCEGLILCHIEPGVYTSNHDKVKSNPLLLGKPVVNIMTMSYLKDETTSMFNHYNENKYKHVAKTLF